MKRNGNQGVVSISKGLNEPAASECSASEAPVSIQQISINQVFLILKLSNVVF